MSLDTKRAEIRKLEEQAQQREDALKRSENMLEEDAMRFDAFLKENDYKAVEAIRKAEQETKAKQVTVMKTISRIRMSRLILLWHPASIQIDLRNASRAFHHADVQTPDLTARSCRTALRR
jgi:succinate dehydrogenase flavin-adding protein (antitoxin of CptAB toxin-antitoxin module)